MIKEAFRQSGSDGENFFELWYSSNKIKPFTFSAYFPIKRENEKQRLNGEFFNVFFSTNDYEFLMRIFNGLKNIGNYNLFGQKIKEVKHFFLAPEKRFDKDTLIFKTVSPFLVRDTEDGDYYLAPDKLLSGKNFKYAKATDEHCLISALKKNIVSLVKKYLNIVYDENNLAIDLEKNSLSPAKHGSGESKFIMTLPAMKGSIKIKAHPEVLKLLYDIGIGARRSEGFGMLEVANE